MLTWIYAAEACAKELELAVSALMRGRSEEIIELAVALICRCRLENL
jgi:hypothetical protein